MQNPWLALPRRPPFVLPVDAPYIRTFNRTASVDVAIDVNLMPEPFIGDPTSPVVILALNPGLSPKDPIINRDPAFRRRIRHTLERRPAARRFAPLEGDHTRPGARWWRRNLKAVLAEVGDECAARNLCCLEYLPYHSKTFDHSSLRLPSQAYTFGLLRKALAREAVVVLTRGARFWIGAVPELADHPRLVCVGNARSASISPRNCGSAFTTVVRELRRAAI